MNKPLNAANVRPRPQLVDRLLHLSPYAGTAIYPYVYVSREVYQNIHSSEPAPQYRALIEHEQAHIKRIGDHGALRWYFNYIASSSFRFSEELEATKAQFAVLKESNIDPDIERRARMFASATYLWCADTDVALAKLKAIWEETETFISNSNESPA